MLPRGTFGFRFISAAIYQEEDPGMDGRDRVLSECAVTQPCAAYVAYTHGLFSRRVSLSWVTD